jgi:hypothetical protein
MTIDRKTLLKYEPLPERDVRGTSHDRAYAIIITLLGMIAVLPVAAWGVSSGRRLILYMWACGGIGVLITLTLVYLGFRDGGLLGIYHRVRYPLANWGEFGPTGGRFIDHNDRWIWRRYAVAWLYFWLWLALPIVAMLH